MIRVHPPHVTRAIALIRAAGVRVHLRPSKHAYTASSSMPWLARPRLHLGMDAKAWAVLLVAAHEYGHCLSVRAGTKVDSYLYFRGRMNASITAEERALLVEEERRAFRFGFAWLRANGLPVTDEMRRDRVGMMRTHLAAGRKAGGAP